MRTSRVVVIGGGISGLSAAHALTKSPDVQLTLLEGSDVLGGQLHTLEIDGVPIDVGAEAIHLGAPHVATLVRELGLDADVVGSAAGTSLLVTRRGPVPLPAGVGPTGPTRVIPVLKARVLSLPGLVRAGLEPLLARRTRTTDDLSVGAFTRSRFGDEVTDTFVDPLLGNLHGGDIDRLSLRATAAQLLPVVRSGESMVIRNMVARQRRLGGPRARLQAWRRRGTTTPSAELPAFANWPGGLTRLTDALGEAVRAAGGDVRTGCAVSRIARGDDRWIVHTATEQFEADHVLLATPGHVSATLLQPLCPQAAEALEAVPMASVATVVLGYERHEIADCERMRDFNGVLVPHNRVRTFKAATNLGRKWPGLDTRLHLVRASVGSSRNQLAVELDDATMVERVADELGAHLATSARPVFSKVVRWPDSMPQLELGHLDRMAEARRQLDELGGLHLSGCAVDGLGIGSTVRSGQKLARQILDQISTREEGRQ